LKLSIIIVNWNTCDLLDGCLSSIYTHPPADLFEVFVVDNGSTDGSVRMVMRRFPQVCLIENHVNLGFSRANNQAIKETTCPYILLLNPDTEVKQGALDTLIDFMDDHPEVGAAGSRLLNPDGTLQVSCYPEPTHSREVWRLFHLDKFHPYGLYPMHTWDSETPRSVEVLQGASLILRRQALDQIGLLDEDYFVYSEEVDLCHRLKTAGWRLYWVPRSLVIHYEGQSTQQVSKEMFMHLYRGKLLYFRKHHGPLSVFLYKCILLTAGLARLSLGPLACFERPPQRQYHLTLASNYLRMILALPRM
jgi:GT2 family glycosyltransferase